jgi:glycosyltransferase involved in cell wall biosynthesis
MTQVSHTSSEPSPAHSVLPGVSVVIAAYNAERYLADAIESCLQQTRVPNQILVVDDGSTDSTARIAESFRHRVTLVSSTANGGVSAARNLGILAATSEWIAFLDADDWFLPRKLETQMAAAEANPAAQVIYTGFLEQSVQGEVKAVPYFTPNELQECLLYLCPLGMSSTMVRKSALQQVGGFLSIPAGPEDWDLWLRLTQRHSSNAFVGVREPLMVYRRTPGSLSFNLRGMMEGRLHVVDQHFPAQPANLRRTFMRRRMRSFIFFDSSLALRHDEERDYLSQIRRSLLEWPFPTPRMGLRRYKIALVMLLQRYFGRRLQSGSLSAPPRS